jgi:hypothetical protein
MHLASGSSLVDAGDIIDGVSYNGSKPDIGCFETGVVTAVANVKESELSPGVNRCHVNQEKATHHSIIITRVSRLAGSLLMINGRNAGNFPFAIQNAPGIYILHTKQ